MKTSANTYCKVTIVVEPLEEGAFQPYQLVLHKALISPDNGASFETLPVALTQLQNWGLMRAQFGIEAMRSNGQFFDLSMYKPQ